MIHPSNSITDWCAVESTTFFSVLATPSPLLAPVLGIGGYSREFAGN